MVGILTKGFVFLASIAETMNVHPDHTFGACLRPDDYGKYTDFLLNKTNNTPSPPPDNHTHTTLCSYVPLKASNFRCLKYHRNINKKSL